MKIVNLLSWYDEDPDLLMQAVLSLARVGVTHLVASDGPYADFPHKTALSAPQQHDAILAACRAADIEMRILKRGVWKTEMAKRTDLWRAADELEPDWVVSSDADMVWRPTVWLPAALGAARAYDVKLVENHEATDVRCVYRWEPGVTVQGAHHCYLSTRGEYLWGPRKLRVPGGRLPAVVDHLRPNLERRMRQHEYYLARDELGTEQLACFFCEKPAKYQADVAEHGPVWLCGLHARDVQRGETRFLVRKKSNLRELNAK